MKNNIKKLWNMYKTFLISPICSVLIILILYAIKGIYPFGNMTIANGDIGQSYIPFYVFLYDVFYNGKSIFYDYALGMGSNMYGGFIVDGMLNPSAFLVLLSTRENIPYMLSFVLIIKIAFIALSSYILFNKIYKNNTYYNIIFSILYAFSGYALMYNTNIMWLDVVGLFPLLILSIKNMFETGNMHWYAIVLALIFIYNYNLGFMVLMFIVLIVPIYIRLEIEKENRKKAMFNLVLGTGLAGGIAAFAILPSFVQVIKSYRMNTVFSNNVKNVNILFKMVVFLFYSLPLYGFCGWISHYKEDKKIVKIYGLALLLTAIIPIFFERVNLMWHMGRYQMFPYRYGFIPILIISLGALRYFNYFEKKENDIHVNKNSILKIFIMCLIFVFVVINGIKNVKILNMCLPSFSMPIICFTMIALSCMVMQLAIYLSYNIKQEKIKKIVILVFSLTEVFMYVYAYIGVYPEYRYVTEWSDEGIFSSYKIKNELNIPNTLYRIKDLAGETTENCPLVHNIPAMSTFLHIISKEQVKNCSQLGYSNGETKITDYGGTILTDAIYGIKYILTKKDLSDKIYNYIDILDNGTKLYEYKNILPLGILYKNHVNDIPKELRAFDAQNYIYKQLFNKQENIIKKIDAKNIKLQNNKFVLEIKDLSELYIYSTTEIKKIIVDGRDFIIPIANDLTNTVYPTGYSKGILDLGTFENKKIEIELVGINENEIKYVQFGILDIDKYNQIFEMNKHNLNIEVNADIIKISGYLKEENANLLIPINYDKGWKVLNDSKQKVEIRRVYNNFIGLELKQGEVNINLKFRPIFYNFGVVISIVSIIILIIMHFVKERIHNSKILLDIVSFIGVMVHLICFIIVYVISILQTFM